MILNMSLLDIALKVRDQLDIIPFLIFWKATLILLKEAKQHNSNHILESYKANNKKIKPKESDACISYAIQM